MSESRTLTYLSSVWLVVGLVLPVQAVITQSARVTYTPASGMVVTNGALVDNMATGMIENDAHGIIAGFFGNARASVGRFGNVGIDAFFLGNDGDALDTTVRLTSNEFFNALTVPQSAVANFIIDGGFIDLQAGLGSTAGFSITLNSSIFDASGALVTNRTFVAGGILEATNDFGTAVMYTPRTMSDDIGAALDPTSTTRLTIPLSFQSLDLGVVPPGGFIDLNYEATFGADVRNFAEGISWGFSDPGDISGFGEAPTVEFTPHTPGPGGAEVPEPATVLCLCALALLGRRGSDRGLD